MADLRSNFIGIKSPNPFWLASAPPTDKAYNVVRAFEAGWGGVVWKTLGEEGPPIVNVSGPRYGAIHGADRRLLGLNNIELITDRPLEVNLQEIKKVKREWPDRAMIVSLMVPCEEKSWKAILPRVEDTGADAIELNFGCPHGMSERGMGAAVGQVPEYIQMVTEWCKQYSKLPVIVKLTPNITDIRNPARAAKRGGADAVSLINTINSIMGVDPYTLTMSPSTGGKGSHGGYCGPAVKPIALNMVAEIARDPLTAGLPISGIGGVGTWRDAVDFIATLRQTEDLSTLPVGRRVVVIGGGMTAVDAAVQSKLLGAEEVHIVYRRGQESMSASTAEQEWAQTNGVTIHHWLAPVEVIGEAGHATGVTFARQALVNGKLSATGGTTTLAADMVLKAIGQKLGNPVLAESGLTLKDGRIATDEAGTTNLKGVWAGGDCRAGGLDLTVEAVEHGKQSAHAIHAFITA